MNRSQQILDTSVFSNQGPLDTDIKGHKQRVEPTQVGTLLSHSENDTSIDIHSESNFFDPGDDHLLSPLSNYDKSNDSVQVVMEDTHHDDQGTGQEAVRSFPLDLLIESFNSSRSRIGSSDWEEIKYASNSELRTELESSISEKSSECFSDLKRIFNFNSDSQARDSPKTVERKITPPQNELSIISERELTIERLGEVIRQTTIPLVGTKPKKGKEEGNKKSRTSNTVFLLENQGELQIRIVCMGEFKEDQVGGLAPSYKKTLVKIFDRLKPGTSWVKKRKKRFIKTLNLPLSKGKNGIKNRSTLEHVIKKGFWKLCDKDHKFVFDQIGDAKIIEMLEKKQEKVLDNFRNLCCCLARFSDDEINADFKDKTFIVLYDKTYGKAPSSTKKSFGGSGSSRRNGFDSSHYTDHSDHSNPKSRKKTGRRGSRSGKDDQMEMVGEEKSEEQGMDQKNFLMHRADPFTGAMTFREESTDLKMEEEEIASSEMIGVQNSKQKGPKALNPSQTTKLLSPAPKRRRSLDEASSSSLVDLKEENFDETSQSQPRFKAILDTYDFQDLHNDFSSLHLEKRSESHRSHFSDIGDMSEDEQEDQDPFCFNSMNKKLKN